MITITISGPQASGKSTLARFIEKTLQGVGLKVCIETSQCKNDKSLYYRQNKLKKAGIQVLIQDYE